MLAGDLPDQCQTKPGPRRLMITLNAEERREDALTFTRRNAGPMIADGDCSVRSLASNLDLDRRRPVPLGILNEVAGHAAQQCPVAEHDDKLAR